MAEYTVYDIKGKGFKYEQYAQEQENAPPPTGTFGCFIGTSNWGPINKPYTITGGTLEFKETFGYAGTRVDHGWDAANLHFRANSALGVYSRIADETIAARSSLLLKNKSDKPAIITGNVDIRNGVIISSSNDTLNIYVQYKEDGNNNVNEMDYLNVDLSDILSSEAEVSGTLSVSPLNMGTSQEINIQINIANGTKRIFSIKPNSIQTINSVLDFSDLIQTSNFTTVKNENGLELNAPKPLITDYFNILISNNIITLKAKSLDYNFKINDPLKVFSKTTLNQPLKTPYVSILNTINNAFNAEIDNQNEVEGVANYSFASINQDGYLVLTGINTGSTSEIYIPTNSINSLLGLTEGEEGSSAGYQIGEQGTSIGTFRAVYRGVEGNTIRLRFYEENNLPNLGIIFRNNLVANIVDYNFDANSDFFLGNLIANDAVANKIIKYDHALQFFDFSDEDEMLSEGITLKQNDGESDIGSDWQIQNGLYSLSGGDSGENSNDLNYTILNIIEELKNLDLYQIDFIAAPGYEEENVQNALINLCSYRQDCFAFLDMPLITGTSKRDAVNKAIRYVNGTYLRTEKLDSIYGVLAFPYVRFRKRFYNSQNLLVSEITLISPTTILPYLYSLKDINTGTSFDIAAGESFGGRILLGANDFTGTQFILNQEDRDILYADSLDACINPISFNTEVGFFLDGQKTTLRKNLNGKLTSLSRISVMRTGLFIKKVSYRISRQYFFAPIDPTTWRDFTNRLTRDIMQPLASSRMIEPNYIVKCDSVTNTAAVRNANGMVAYIEFTPYKKLERIKVIANITETDATLTIE
jgi:hypothetical protein